MPSSTRISIVGTLVEECLGHHAEFSILRCRLYICELGIEISIGETSQLETGKFQLGSNQFEFLCMNLVSISVSIQFEIKMYGDKNSRNIPKQVNC